MDRELDAKVAEEVMGIEVVARDWPCGWPPDGQGYEAALGPDQPASWYTDRGPVYVPFEHGTWPPEKDKFGKEYADVEPVSFYSSDWNDMAEVLQVLGEAGEVVLLKVDGLRFPNPDNPNCTVTFMGQRWDHDELPVAVCRAALEWAERNR